MTFISFLLHELSLLASIVFVASCHSKYYSHGHM